MAADLRAQVLDASVQLIAEAGLAGLSMREVARRAGVSHQAPYHHFHDKESIVAALVERGFGKLADRMEAAAAGKGTVAQRLAKTGREYVEFALAEPVFFRLMFRPELVALARFPAASAAGARAFTVLQRLIDERTEGTRASQAKKDALVSMHWSVVHGLAALMIDGVLGEKYLKVEDREKHVAMVLELFADGAV
ncbi:MAG: TetR/AcrR family transcriptional regulator [Myxococcales bacterium]|nr:TetR/AcrR family transcriptional regulator [Myxococcales bacterium]